MKTKKEKLAAIKAELESSCSLNGYIKNIGKVFFSLNGGACVLRDVVYHRSLAHGIDFELLSLDGQYFAGSKAHAEALKEAFGGTVKPSEYCFLAQNSREIYIWEKSVQWQKQNGFWVNPTPIDYDEAVEALFS